MDSWKNKQKVIVQLVCILLSLCLWIYVTNIKNPIKSYELKNVPVEILNSNDFEKKIKKTCRVEGKDSIFNYGIAERNWYSE